MQIENTYIHVDPGDVLTLSQSREIGVQHARSASGTFYTGIYLKDGDEAHVNCGFLEIHRVTETQKIVADSKGEWRVTHKLGISLAPDERITIKEGEVCVEKKVNNEITEDCEVCIKKSHHSDGYYVAVKHKGKVILVLGLDEKSKMLIKSDKYRFTKAVGGAVSFHIFKD